MAGYMQAAGLVGQLGTDIWGLIEGDDLFGKKPEVAPWKNINLTDQQKKSILGNISNFEDISKLGKLYTDYTTQSQNQLLPGYSDILAKGAAGTSKLLDVASGFLSGVLPADVQSAVQRGSAYGALQGGFAGSGMARNLTARDLGLTSLDLMQRGAQMLGQGQNTAAGWAGLAGQDILNPASFFTTPQQMFQDTFANQLQRQAYLQNKYNVAAAPDPQVAGTYGLISNRFGQLSGMGGGGGSTGGFDIMSLFGGGTQLGPGTGA